MTTPGAAAVPERAGLSLRDHVLMTYPTPIVIYPWPDSAQMNAELRALFLGRAQNSPGVVKSNVGGWHSELDLFSSDHPAVRALLGRIERLMVDLTALFLDRREADRKLRFRAEGWANVLRGGDYCNLHNHGNAHWSGVYYVTGNPRVPGRPFSGKLEFADPRAAAAMLTLEHTTIYGRQILDPQPGTMVVFPSWLQHQVHPYFGPDERISVAFNVVVAPVSEAAGKARPS